MYCHRRVAVSFGKWTYIKYPDAIQLVWLLEFKAFPMVERATARVVWSMRATKSTAAHARNIYRVVRIRTQGYMFL
jgi:hypothetical protein